MNSACAWSCADRELGEFGSSRVAVRAACSDSGIAGRFAVDLRELLQRLHFGGIAAPDHRQQFQLAQHVRLLDLVALLLEGDLEQLRLGRRLAIVGGDHALVFVERVEVVPERFGEPSAQHGGRGLQVRRHADDLELGATLGGPGIILDLERGAHGIHRHDALQVDRQRGDREFDILELLARLGPFRLSRQRQRLPHLGIVVGTDRGIGEILQPPAWPADQDACDRMHHQRDGFVLLRIGVGERHFGDALGFRIHGARHVEAGEIEPRLRTQVGLGARQCLDQSVFAFQEIPGLVLAPLLDVEQRTHRDRRALG